MGAQTEERMGRAGWEMTPARVRTCAAAHAGAALPRVCAHMHGHGLHGGGHLGVVAHTPLVLGLQSRASLISKHYLGVLGTCGGGSGLGGLRAAWWKGAAHGCGGPRHALPMPTPWHCPSGTPPKQGSEVSRACRCKSTPLLTCGIEKGGIPHIVVGTLIIFTPTPPPKQAS